MRVLALNPHHGGSHKAFLDGWIAHSRHEFDVLSLPAYKWKWRMRHAPVTFAEQLASRTSEAQDWDALFCTDMLNLAEFLGLAHERLRRLPSVIYFHENQLTYPNQGNSNRDLHFAFTNITSCLAASAVWFNSKYHLDSFTSAVDDWMVRMPDFKLSEAAAAIRERSTVVTPGIEIAERTAPRTAGPLRIAWVSRWEHDKDPDTFFAGLEILAERDIDFRLFILGEFFAQSPDCFNRAKQRFAKQIEQWGYAESRERYIECLHQADVVVSTARHEFFGIGVLEAVAAGCFPLVPRSLAYPEVLGDRVDFFHDGSPASVADRLSELSHRLESRESCWYDSQEATNITAQFSWQSIAHRLDDAMALLSG